MSALAFKAYKYNNAKKKQHKYGLQNLMEVSFVL